MHGYPVDNLWDAHNARLLLWALCRNCGHVAPFKPYALIRKSRHSDQKLWDVSKRLKCQSCQLHVTVLIPSHEPYGKRNER